MPRVATNALCQPEKNTFAKEGRAKEQKNLQTDQLNNPKVYCTPEFPLWDNSCLYLLQFKSSFCLLKLKAS